MSLSSAARHLTFERLLTAIVFIAVFAMAVRAPVDTDTWWHLQSGRWIVEHRAIPRTDQFSHTRYGQPWIDHGWLAEALLFLIYDTLGCSGLALLVAALVTAAFGFVWLQCGDGNRWLRAFALIIAAAASGVIWSARPQMVSFTLAAVVAYLLHRYKRGDQKAIWWLPLIILLWVNTHGGFAVGFILMAAYGFGELGNRLLQSPGVGLRGVAYLAVVFIVCLLMVPLNPNGVQMWTYPFRTVGIGVLQDFIAEWRPPDFHQLQLHPFIWLVLAVIAAVGLSRQPADFSDLTLVSLFAYMSLLAVRNVALFALVAAPVVVRYGSHALTEWSERRARERISMPVSTRRQHPLLNTVLLALVAVAAAVNVAHNLSPAASQEAWTANLPVDAVAFLKDEHPPGPLFNSYNWGGYIIWELPEYPVFVDGRTDLYDDAFLREYLSIVFTQDGWEKQLDSYDINLVLIEPQSALGRMLGYQSENRTAESPGWKRVYGDESAVVFARR